MQQFNDYCVNCGHYLGPHNVNPCSNCGEAPTEQQLKQVRNIHSTSSNYNECGDVGDDDDDGNDDYFNNEELNRFYEKQIKFYTEDNRNNFSEELSSFFKLIFVFGLIGLGFYLVFPIIVFIVKFLVFIFAGLALFLLFAVFVVFMIYLLGKL